MSFLPFWALNMVVALLSMQGQKALGFHPKYLNLCSEDELRSYRFGRTWGWVINDRIFIFGWTIPLTFKIRKSKEVATDHFFPYCDILYIFFYIYKKRCAGTCFISIGCGLDGGISEYELAVNCKKEMGVKWTKWLEESGIHHQRICLLKITRSKYETCMDELFTIRSLICI